MDRTGPDMSGSDLEACDPGPRAEGEDGLLRDGWQRCFVAEEPRLSEAIETYEELGFEVKTVPVDVRGGGCTECMKAHPGRHFVIFTRRRRAESPAEGGENDLDPVALR